MLELLDRSDGDRLDLSDQLLLEAVVPQRSGHVHARERAALLALILEGSSDRLVDDQVDVGRRMAAAVRPAGQTVSEAPHRVLPLLFHSHHVEVLAPRFTYDAREVEIHIDVGGNPVRTSPVSPEVPSAASGHSVRTASRAI